MGKILINPEGDDFLNINCSLRCIHQKNGKCILKSLDTNPVLIGYDPNGKECPYFSGTPKGL